MKDRKFLKCVIFLKAPRFRDIPSVWPTLDAYTSTMIRTDPLPVPQALAIRRARSSITSAASRLARGKSANSSGNAPSAAAILPSRAGCGRHLPPSQAQTLGL
jgi:hypothetical protein